MALAAALFAIVLVLKLVVTTPGFGFPLLYDIPVALVAIAFGVRAGLIAAAVGMVLYAIGDASAELHSNVWGYLSRALTFVLLGGLLGFYSDRLRGAEARARESEARFRSSLSDSPIVVWQQDRDLTYTWIHNPMLGFNAEEVLGRTDEELVPPETAALLTGAKKEVLETGEARQIEVAYPGAEEPVYFDVALNPLRGRNGEVAGLTGVATDITRSRRTEEELRKSQLGLNRSQGMARLGSWEWDIETNAVTWSDELHRLYGTSPDGFEASYEAFIERVHPDDREMMEEAVRKAYAAGESFELDHRIVRPDGEVLTLHAYGEVTLDAEGKPITMAGTGQDVTEHRAADEANRRLAAIVDQSQDAIIAKDTEAIVTEWNRGAEQLYGYSAEEAIGKPIAMIIPPDRAGEDRAVLARILEGDPLERYETVRLRKDGSRVEVWLTISPLRDADGAITGASSISRDVRELKRAQRELERSNKDLEQFAYVASHDLQEPLRSISGFVQVLERRYRGQLDSDADRFLGFILSGVDRMQTLIDDLLTYSRSGQTELRREPVDTGEVVKETLASLDAAVKEAGAEIEIGALPTVDTDPHILGQVFQNLISNALKFTDDQRPHVEVSAEPTAGAWSFAVADNGIGIDPAQAERIFRMFHRLHGRDEYGGTGIGLAISKRVVERLGGRIWCEPRPDGGTVFRFTVPGADTSGPRRRSARG